jgi:hypothetical protein
VGAPQVAFTCGFSTFLIFGYLSPVGGAPFAVKGAGWRFQRIERCVWEVPSSTVVRSLVCVRLLYRTAVVFMACRSRPQQGADVVSGVKQVDSKRPSSTGVIPSRSPSAVLVSGSKGESDAVTAQFAKQAAPSPSKKPKEANFQSRHLWGLEFACRLLSGIYNFREPAICNLSLHLNKGESPSNVAEETSNLKPDLVAVPPGLNQKRRIFNRGTCGD